MHADTALVDLPPSFIWSRSGPEAGEDLDTIVTRKQLEERAFGTFTWGIGSDIRKAFKVWRPTVTEPMVYFSPIRSKPRKIDVAPPSLYLWLSYFDGTTWRQCTALVTSHGRAPYHFAIVGHDLRRVNGTIDLRDVRNVVGDTNVGSSQTTAVVRRVDACEAPRHAIVLFARVRDVVLLGDPVEIDADAVREACADPDPQRFKARVIALLSTLHPVRLPAEP